MPRSLSILAENVKIDYFQEEPWIREDFVIEILIAMFKQVERADGKTEQIARRPLSIPIRDSCHLNCVVPQFHSELVVAIPDS